MLLVTCPYCGPRAETEFRNGGQAHLARPPADAALSDQQWAEHLYYRSNPRGRHAERWLHVHGCARWFNALRDTGTDAFLATYRIGEMPPVPDAAAS